jgi:hopanoid-associated phosphorylase
MTLGILCGLETEATAARGVKDALVACAAARPQRARQVARELAQRGATRLLGFGLAGGLEPGLPPGSLIIGTSVQTPNATWTCDPTWRAALKRVLPVAREGLVWGAEVIVARARDKRALYECSRCLAVDMESRAVAEVAAELGLPFAVLRVIADPSGMDLPPAALESLREDGRVDSGRVAASILCHPAQIPALIHLGFNTGKAMRALRMAAEALR